MSGGRQQKQNREKCLWFFFFFSLPWRRSPGPPPSFLPFWRWRRSRRGFFISPLLLNVDEIVCNSEYGSRSSRCLYTICANRKNGQHTDGKSGLGDRSIAPATTTPHRIVPFSFFPFFFYVLLFTAPGRPLKHCARVTNIAEKKRKQWLH